MFRAFFRALALVIAVTVAVTPMVIGRHIVRIDVPISASQPASEITMRLSQLGLRTLTVAISELRSAQRDGSDPDAQRHLGFFFLAKRLKSQPSTAFLQGLLSRPGRKRLKDLLLSNF